MILINNQHSVNGTRLLGKLNFLIKISQTYKSVCASTLLGVKFTLLHQNKN